MPVQPPQVPGGFGRRRRRRHARHRRRVCSPAGMGADPGLASPRRAPSCACCAGAASCRATSTPTWPTSSFTEKTGVEVRVDNEGWEDVQPEGRGGRQHRRRARTSSCRPTTMPTSIPSKLLDVTDLAEYLGKKYGGWYPAVRAYAPDGKNGSRSPLGRPARDRLPPEHGEGGRLRHASRRTPPASWSCEGAEGKGHAGRHGARPRHRRRPVVQLADLVHRRQAGRQERQGRHRQSPETLKALEYAKELYGQLHPRHRCRGSTRTTTRRSSTARSASPTTASRSTLRPRRAPPRAIRR